MADGNVKPFEAPPMLHIVEESSASTLLNVNCILDFMARRLNEIGSNGMDLDDNDRDAMFRILMTVSDAIGFEQGRASEAERLLAEVKTVAGGDA